jgi:hypothetical protein
VAGYLKQYALPSSAVGWTEAIFEEQGLTIADEQWISCGHSASEESGKLEYLHDRA